MNKLILVILIVVSSFYSKAESKQCRLPEKLAGYTLFFELSGMDYKVDLDTMVLRKLSFSNNWVENENLITGQLFKAYYIYSIFPPDIAFIEVYQTSRLETLLYRDILVCQTNIVGKLIYSPEVSAQEVNLSEQLITGKYILKKTMALL
ncbi:hypothetical protein [uncultured Shewanella sp.]|uniref:hypothetical protein n=1 Tax=uncultured Shewanella sp. TaxID=173975 RepID=UPI00262F1F95|nr:hypothetical protein [uncultured Shewanella sp.]